MLMESVECKMLFVCCRMCCEKASRHS